MSRRRSLTIPVLLVALLSSSAFGCPYPSPGPPTGTTDLGIPFIIQATYYYCVPASVLMWRQFKMGNTGTTQPQIWDWMKARFGSNQVQDGFGASADATTAAAEWFIGSTEYATYQTAQDRIQLRQAVADQQQSISEGQPLIVTTQQATHVVVLKGVTWNRLNDALARPNMEYVHLNDPGLFSGQYAAYTLGEWMNVQILIQTVPCLSYGCVFQWQKYGLRGRGIPGLEQFDDEGGTYVGPGPADPTGRWKDDGWGGCYWEPNDSGPDQCSGSGPTGRYKDDGNGGCYWDPNDGGPDQCVPLKPAALLVVQHHSPLATARRVVTGLFRTPDALATFSRSASATPGSAPLAGRRPSRVRSTQVAQDDQTSKTATKNGTFIPHPYSTKPSEIVENILTTARQTHLADAIQLPALKDRNSGLTARRVLDVKSLTKRADYYMVELQDRSGRLVANVAIEKSGIILGAQRVDHPDLQRPLDLPDAAARGKKFGPVGKTQYVHLIGPAEIGSPIFVPLAAVEGPDGTIYFNSRGEAYAEETSALAKRVGVYADKPLPPGMMKLRKLKDR